MSIAYGTKDEVKDLPPCSEEPDYSLNLKYLLEQMWKMCRQKVKQVLLLCHLLPNFSLPLTAHCSLLSAQCSLLSAHCSLLSALHRALHTELYFALHSLSGCLGRVLVKQNADPSVSYCTLLTGTPITLAIAHLKMTATYMR